MASPLDIGLVQVFQIIFPFLFVLTVMFAFLTQIKPFKENQVFGAIMAVSLAVLTMFSPLVIKIINTMAPWFVLVFVGVVFLLLAYYIIGYDDVMLKEAINTGEYNGAIAVWVVAIVLIISIGSTASVISQEKGFSGLTAENATAPLVEGETEQAGFFQTILHPKVLGMAVVMLVAFFAVSALTKQSVK